MTPAGASVPLVEDELDQAQHDGVSDVLSVPSAGMLVRRAVFDEQLRQTHSFADAFAKAVPVIAQREVEAGKQDGFSNPQIHVGPQIAPVLRMLERRLATAAHTPSDESMLAQRGQTREEPPPLNTPQAHRPLTLR